ncbi:MAG: hypothetical protein P8X81_01315 [Woeseiaceae bacterium]|jgi:hypothetical protein
MRHNQGEFRMAEWLERFKDDPLIYPQKLVPAEDRVLLVELTEEILQGHSFLDDRIFHTAMPFEWLPWRDFEQLASALSPRAPSYIFHIGHCGSTLLSRLVAEATGSLALREPLPLRVLAINRAESVVDWLDDKETHKRLRLFERTWSRGDRPTTVKATSMCTNLVSEVNKDSRVVFMYQPAETHLAVLLAGENSMQDLAGFGRNRHTRLGAITEGLPPLQSMSGGELAALTWLAEVSSAAPALRERAAFSLDFDTFLTDPEELLRQTCGALGLETTAEQCTKAVAGPIMRSYSKAPEHNYGPKLREDIIADSKRRNTEEIKKGMRFVERFRPTTCGADWR